MWVNWLYSTVVSHFIHTLTISNVQWISAGMAFLRVDHQDSGFILAFFDDWYTFIATILHWLFVLCTVKLRSHKSSNNHVHSSRWTQKLNFGDIVIGWRDIYLCIGRVSLCVCVCSKRIFIVKKHFHVCQD